MRILMLIAAATILLGAGYEFSPHRELGAFVGAGRTKDRETVFRHAQVSVMVRGTFF